jgi:hypothetical protein
MVSVSAERPIRQDPLYPIFRITLNTIRALFHNQNHITDELKRALAPGQDDDDLKRSQELACTAWQKLEREVGTLSAFLARSQRMNVDLYRSQIDPHLLRVEKNLREIRDRSGGLKTAHVENVDELIGLVEGITLGYSRVATRIPIRRAVSWLEAGHLKILKGPDTLRFQNFMTPAPIFSYAVTRTAEILRGIIRDANGASSYNLHFDPAHVLKPVRHEHEIRQCLETMASLTFRGNPIHLRFIAQGIELSIAAPGMKLIADNISQLPAMFKDLFVPAIAKEIGNLGQVLLKYGGEAELFTGDRDRHPAQGQDSLIIRLRFPSVPAVPASNSWTPTFYKAGLREESVRLEGLTYSLRDKSGAIIEVEGKDLLDLNRRTALTRDINLFDTWKSEIRQLRSLDLHPVGEPSVIVLTSERSFADARVSGRSSIATSPNADDERHPLKFSFRKYPIAGTFFKMPRSFLASADVRQQLRTLSEKTTTAQVELCKTLTSDLAHAALAVVNNHLETNSVINQAFSFISLKVEGRRDRELKNLFPRIEFRAYLPSHDLAYIAWTPPNLSGPNWRNIATERANVLAIVDAFKTSLSELTQSDSISPKNRERFNGQLNEGLQRKGVCLDAEIFASLMRRSSCHEIMGALVRTITHPLMEIEVRDGMNYCGPRR